MANDAVNQVEGAPRKLGDQWESWNGQVEENNGDLDTSPWFFIGFVSVAVTMLSGAGLLLLYLIEPRLISIHPMAATLTYWAGIAFIALLNAALVLIILTVVTEKPFAFFLRAKEVANSPLIPLSFKIGQKFGLSRDRLANSLLKVSNSVNRALYPKVKPEELLIVVPRCLSKFMRNELAELTEKYGITFHTATGGNAARELLVTKRPKAVIAVACERDLLSGVQDVGGAVPVITIANKRPEGPCRNTFIDMEEMEKSIQFFLGADRNNSQMLITQ